MTPAPRHRPARSSSRVARPTAAVAGVLLALAGCSGGGDDPQEQAATVDGVPQSWLDETTEDWPDSTGFGGTMPVLSRDTECVLGDSLPEVLGVEGEVRRAGWGPFGSDASDKETFQYQCDFGADDHYAGGVWLRVTPDEAQLQEVVDDFTQQTDTPVQDNTVGQAEVAGEELHTLERWYPTNPHGEYQAMYVDEDAGAVLVWTVNSLDEQEFEEYSSQRAAEDLIALMAAAQ